MNANARARAPELVHSIALEGEWDLARRQELWTLLSRLSLDGEATIDLRGCTYADSTILSALAMLRVKFADKGITLVGPSPQLQRILRIADFDELFKIVDAP